MIRRPAQRAALAASVTLLVAGAVVPDAGAQSNQLEPTIIVSAVTGATARSQTTLVFGRTYRVVVEGSYLKRFTTASGGTFSYAHDGVYCFEDSGGNNICSASAPKVFDSGLRAREGGSGSFEPFYRGLRPSRDAPGFRANHLYEHEFVAGATAPLELAIGRQPNDTYSGELRVTLYGPPSPGSTGPPAAPGVTLQDLLSSEGCVVSLATPLVARPRLPAQWLAVPSPTPADDFCPRRGRANEWNVKRPLGTLEPGDEAVVESPALGADQRSATVTLSTSKGDVAVALSLDDARFRRFARLGCIALAARKLTNDLKAAGVIRKDQMSIDAGQFALVAGHLRYLLPCLQTVDDRLADANAKAGAAAAGCGALRFPMQLLRGGDPNVVRFRAARGTPIPRELNVSCRSVSGGLELRVRPRRARTALRRVVGPRLAIGLARHPRTSGPAGTSVAFRR